MTTANPATGGGELMSSIAAVRQLLLHEYPAASSSPGQPRHPRRHSLSDELSSVQQSRYEDRLKFEEERNGFQEVVEDLKLRLSEAKQEAQQEKAIRRTLEETNEALEQHKEELSSQLDAVSSLPSSSSSAPQDVAAVDTTATQERVQELEKEKEDLTAKWSESQKQVQEMKQGSETWKTQCLASQRQVKEIQMQLDTSKKQYQTSQDRQKELLEGQDTKYESFQKRLEESAAARKKAEEELQAMIRQKSSASSTTPESRSPIEDSNASTNEATAELKRKYDEAASARVKAHEKVSIAILAWWYSMKMDACLIMVCHLTHMWFRFSDLKWSWRC
jgi:DNA repair exonuclease SbcCD ATPase subunit